MTPLTTAGEPPPPIDPDDALALLRLADDGNPNHEDLEVCSPRRMVTTPPPAPGHGPAGVEPGADDLARNAWRP